MKKLLCRLFDHKWRAILNSETQHSVCLVCLRCKENGWRLP